MRRANGLLCERWQDLIDKAHEGARNDYSREQLADWNSQFLYQPYEDELPFFIDFLTFNFALKDGKSIAELYLDEQDAFTSERLNSPYSLYKVTELPGPGQYVLTDLLRKNQRHILMISPKEGIFRMGLCCFAKLVKGEGEVWVPISLHPVWASEEAGGGIASEILGSRKSCETSTLLQHKNASRLYQYWQALTELAYDPPDLVNFDGEEISLNRQIWSFEPKKRDWLLVALGKVKELEKQGDDSFVFRGEERPLGTVELKDTEIWIDSNSYERSEIIEIAILEHCEDFLSFVGEIGEEELRAMWLTPEDLVHL